MKVAVRKLQIEDAAKLQMLVAENIDAIEPGLVVLDSRLLLGQATIDVVGLDTNGALVLIATGLTANEEMLLKAVEAYSWCREYPQSLERLYPTCVISDARPPRLLFVVERMPDAFQRKIKQLGFPEVDCVEFRLLDVEGAPVVFFESILRLRRAAVTPPAAPAAEAQVDAPAGAENVIALNGPVAARATSLKLQKLLHQAAVESAPRATDRPLTPSREPAAIVSMVSRQAAAPRGERLREAAPVIAPAPVIAAAPVVAPMPVVDAAPAVVRQPEPLVVPGPAIITPEPVIAMPPPVVVVPAPVIVTPEPIVLPKAAVEADADLADADLMAQMERALAAIDHHATIEPEPLVVDELALQLAAEPVVAAEPKLEVVVEPEPIVIAEPKLELAVALEPVVAAEPKLELAVEPESIVIAEPKLEMIVEPEPVVVAEPKLELAEPKLELVVEPVVAPIAEPVVAAAPKPEPIVAAVKPEIPSLNGGAAKSVASRGAERISLRSLPELSLQPSAPVAMPRPAPIPTPAPVAAPVIAAPAAVAKPAAEAQEPRVSFKDLASALLGPAAAPAKPAPTVEPVIAPVVAAPVEQAPVLQPTPSALHELVARAAAETPADVVVEPVSQAMADAVAELEPALTVEALIKSTLAPAPAAPVAPAAAAPVPETPKPAAAALPLEFEGLKFPNDGVLTRQWMEFLSQMSTTK